LDDEGNVRKLVDINTNINERKLAEDLVVEKNKDITASIRYAKQIQEAILPSDDEFKSLIPDSFVFYKPKDIVSGDFYWLTKKKGKILIAACDCTGHGVPGAFMSMIGNSLLNEIVNEKGILKPSTILNTVRDEVIRSLKQTVTTFDDQDNGALDRSEVKDGMDAALCSLDLKSMKLEYAGAYNALYYIKSADKERELQEIKADKWPIGIWGKNMNNQ